MEISEVCVFNDLVDTFRLGVRPLSGEEKPIGSLFCSTFLLLGENCADLSSVGVHIFGIARGALMKPYLSTVAPSTSSQSSSPPASSVSRLPLSARWEKELADLGVPHART